MESQVEKFRQILASSGEILTSTTKSETTAEFNDSVSDIPIVYVQLIRFQNGT